MPVNVVVVMQVETMRPAESHRPRNPPPQIVRGRSRTGQSGAVPDMSPADQLVAAIHLGDVEGVDRLVTADAGLASSPLGGRHGTRTPLHVVADWPGYW